MQDLRSLVEEQRAELESQRRSKAQQLKMEAFEEKLGEAPSEPAATPAAGSRRGHYPQFRLRQPRRHTPEPRVRRRRPLTAP